MVLPSGNCLDDKEAIRHYRNCDGISVIPPPAALLPIEVFMFHRVLPAICWILMPFGFASAQVTELRVYPESVTLDGPRARQQLVVLGKQGDGRYRDLTPLAKVTINDAKVVVANESVLTPVGDGKTVVEIVVEGLTKSIPVAVTKAKADVPVSFTREIEPVLTKVGCNSGVCHGAQLGRGGFRLSLFGFDPAF